MISSSQLAKTLLKMSAEEADSKNILDKFFLFVAQYKLESLLPAVLFELERSATLQKKEEQIEITTAHELSLSAQNHIQALIGAPKTAQTVLRVNQDLLGGFKARYKGLEYQGSLSYTVDTLEKSLRQEV